MLSKQGSTIDSLSFSPDGTRLLVGTGAIGGGSLTSYIYSVPSGVTLTLFSQNDNIVLATAFSPDGKTVATGGGSVYPIYLWDPQDGSIVKKTSW